MDTWLNGTTFRVFMLDFVTYLRYLRLMEEMLLQDLQVLMKRRNRNLGVTIFWGRALKFWLTTAMVYKLLHTHIISHRAHGFRSF